MNRTRIEMWLIVIANFSIWAVVVFGAIALFGLFKKSEASEQYDPYPTGYAIIYQTQPGMPFVPDYLGPRLRVQRLGSQIQIQQTYPGTDVPDYFDGHGYIIQTYPGVDENLYQQD